MLARKTANGNYLVLDTSTIYRFVNSEGKHLRWVEDDEADYLVKIMEKDSFPELEVDNHPLPTTEIIWQHVTPPENPELSNNGGSYAYLYRIEELKGWGGGVDGFRLVTNHLWNSDFEEQGWNVKYFDSHTEMYEYIENFKIRMVA
jgi:hypothetical protein